MKPLMFIMSKETLLEKINALEPCMRAYIHEIESRCDPSGDIRTIADLREQVRALHLKVEEKELLFKKALGLAKDCSGSIEEYSSLQAIKKELQQIELEGNL